MPMPSIAQSAVSFLLEDSKEHFKQAVGLNPDVGPPHLNLGIILLKKGDKEEGRKELLLMVMLLPRLLYTLIT